MTAYNVTADSSYPTADSTLLTADSDPYALPAPVTKVADDYVALITPWQSTKARFVATVRAQVQPQSDAQAAIASLPAAFDIDLAIGAQLDAVGQWVGRSRNVPTPLPNTIFSFDIDGLGFDQGYWQGPYDTPNGITVLPDDLYRRLLYAKVAANSWDGTADGAEAILRTYLTDPASVIFIDDDAQAVAPIPYFGFDQDGHGFDESNWYKPIFAMDQSGLGFDEGYWLGPGEYSDTPDRVQASYGVCISGKIPSAIDLAILDNGLIPVKAVGAAIEYAVTTVDNAPIFGFDMDDAHIGGFDNGAWAASPATVAALNT